MTTNNPPRSLSSILADMIRPYELMDNTMEHIDKNEIITDKLEEIVEPSIAQMQKYIELRNELLDTERIVEDVKAGDPVGVGLATGTSVYRLGIINTEFLMRKLVADIHTYELVAEILDQQKNS